MKNAFMTRMNYLQIWGRLLFVLTAMLPLPLLAQAVYSDMAMDSSETVWDLTDLYPNLDEWETAMQQIREEMNDLQTCRGQVASSKMLIHCMTSFTATLQKLLRAHVYASLKADADTNDQIAQRHRQQADLLYNEMEKIASFYEPELTAKGARILKLTRAGKPLEDYDFYFSDLLRKSKHTLSVKEERILAEAEGPFQEFYETYNVLMNAEIPWPQMATPEGKEILLNSQGYGAARQSLDREYRALIFNTYFSTLQKFSQTAGNLLSGQVRSQVAVAQVRGYQSALDASLYHDNLPPAVYTTLVETTRASLPSLHRYFRFRREMMNLPFLNYYDIYPPLVPALERTFSLEAGNHLVLQAVGSLGADYSRMMHDSMAKNWVHPNPAPGKRSGAYMNGSAYDVHPYILLNYNESFHDVSTLAHEWGHALHSLYSNKHQPFTKADYSTFTAEMAAILPQTLLIDHMIEQATSPEERLYYLTQAMEDIRGTFYRQAMFAEFEQQIHTMAEKGKVVDAMSLSKAYGALVREYHGTERDLVDIPSYIDYEWVTIPHFYYNFYVFQYATSMAASFYMAEEIRTKGKPAVTRFLDILRAGNSDYPYNLLKKAGIDMADADIYKAVAQRLEYLLDQAQRVRNDMDTQMETQELQGIQDGASEQRGNFLQSLQTPTDEGE